MTVSLCGAFIVYLKAQLIKEAIHSSGSGLVRDIFHVFRCILDRIDNAQTGEILKSLFVDIPTSHLKFGT